MEQVLAADEQDERGRWGSGVYGCGHGDQWSETLEEVFGRVLGDGWWEQVAAEAEARQSPKAWSPRYDEDGNEYAPSHEHRGFWTRVTSAGDRGVYRLTDTGDLVALTDAEIEALDQPTGEDRRLKELVEAALLGAAVGFRYGWDRQVTNRPDVPTDEHSLREFAKTVSRDLVLMEHQPDYNPEPPRRRPVPPRIDRRLPAWRQDPERPLEL